MHLFHVIVVLYVLLLVGVEFSVSAFVNPSAWRLDAEPQARLLSHLAAVLGRVMPFWYAGGLVLLGAETWLHGHEPGFAFLLTASVIWFLTTLLTILFLVPLNNLVVRGGPGWQRAHHLWDTRHRFRIVALTIAGTLLTYVVVC